MIEGDEEITPQRALDIERTAQSVGVLLIWTVTTNTKDHGKRFVARPHDPLMESNTALPFYLIADSLDGLREMLPPGLTHLDRQPGDLPVIVESWL